MYLAVSNDGYRWEEFNGGEPVLISEVGTKQVRDPFVYEDVHGRFHAVWTNGWESHSIGYAYSDNLKDWQGQKLLPVMEAVEGTVNVWAPEIFYDKAQGKHRIIWSSTVLEEGEEKKRDHRIWSALTGDFSEVEPASLFFDPGYNVIDACIVDLGDRCAPS
jgi:sucrose-6-phosphate hydrolase SacC (GH32 family)